MVTTMSFAISKAHRRNVERYRRLLNTQLTDLERSFVESRLSAELAALDALSQLEMNAEQRNAHTFRSS